MTSRILPFEEWDRLPESLDPMLMGMRPETCRVCVVEEGGEIVGHLILFPVLHAEALWIAPAYRRRVRVMRYLLTAMSRSARALGFDRVWGASDSETMTKILAHPRLGGIPIPALSVVLPIERTT